MSCPFFFLSLKFFRILSFLSFFFSNFLIFLFRRDEHVHLLKIDLRLKKSLFLFFNFFYDHFCREFSAVVVERQRTSNGNLYAKEKLSQHNNTRSNSASDKSQGKTTTYTPHTLPPTPTNQLTQTPKIVITGSNHC